MKVNENMWYLCYTEDYEDCFGGPAGRVVIISSHKTEKQAKEAFLRFRQENKHAIGICVLPGKQITDSKSYEVEF